MEEIDYQTIIVQLQTENELLRHQMHSFLRVRDSLQPLAILLRDIWQRVVADRMNLLFATMIVYWLVQTALAIYDRFGKQP